MIQCMNLTLLDSWTSVSNESAPPWQPPPLPYARGPTADFSEYTPWDLFSLFLTPEMTELILQKTIEHARRASDDTFQLSMQELNAFIGVLIYTGIDVRPTVRDHFQQSFFGQSPVASVLTERRFWQIMQHFAVHDNQSFIPRGSPGHDPYAPVRPFYNLLCSKLLVHYRPGRAVSVDESMHACRSRCWFVQYNSNKHHRWGLKHFVLACSETGYVLHTVPYLGAHTETATTSDGLLASERSCMQLVEKLPEPGHIVVMDRFYSGAHLFELLAEKGFGAIGTVRRNRVGLPPAVREVKKSDLPRPKFLRKGKLLHCSWFDKDRYVPMLSTFHKAETKLVAVRDKRAVPFGFRSVEKPKIVVDYNHCMGGVDQGDQMMQSYRLYPHRCNRWRTREIIRLMEIAVHNSFVLYSSYQQNRLTSSQFRLNLLWTLWSPYLQQLGLTLPKFLASFSSHLPDPLSVTTDEYLEDEQLTIDEITD